MKSVLILRFCLSGFLNGTYDFLKIGPIKTLNFDISKMVGASELVDRAKCSVFYAHSNDVSQR